ncbi:hypothetical protein NQ314_017930 [Rhamnusium bicolor]|uniref:Apolipoprotein L3 n=1 Tax=Rhamnusium bicolor TaxID=1586634 RepID=A0AAV8WTA9_9CUCU|nr:hypothetical protein NQ314_017930 [Rhamnusium bicolor]
MNSEVDINASDFQILLRKYIQKLGEIIEQLNDLLKTITSHHKSCNIAKTAGTFVSGTGVVMVVGSVLLSPITGGGSLIVGASGAVMSLTGGLSNVVTDYVDYRTSNLIMNNIQSIIETKQDFDETLNKQLKHLGMIIEKLIESGVDKDRAIVIAIKGIADGCINLTEEPNMKMMNALSTIVKLHHIESAALETLPLIGKTMHISEKSFQFIYNFFGLSGHSAAAVFKIIGRISSVISITFTLVDIAFLVRDWTTEHPTVEVVLETVMKLQEEKEILNDLLEVIDASKDKVELVLDKVLEDIENLEQNFESDFVFVPREVENY